MANLLCGRICRYRVSVTWLYGRITSLRRLTGGAEPCIVQSRLDPEGDVIAAVNDSGSGIREEKLPRPSNRSVRHAFPAG